MDDRLAESTAKTVYVTAGDVKVSSSPCTFTTVLGSCVSVCLYDPVLRCGGMNHFMHVGSNPRSPGDTRWSGPAIHQLIDSMIRLGSNPGHLVAKVVGGANVMKAITYRIGDINAAEALEELKRRRIRVSTTIVGGDESRKIRFRSYTGEVELI